MKNVIISVAALFVVGILLKMSLYVLYPWHSSIILQFGEIVNSKQTAGISFKFPWQDLRKFDSRVLTFDDDEEDRYITAEKENLIVDSFVKWRIIDPTKYYERLLGSEIQASARLQEIINRGMRDEIGKRTIHEVIKEDREEVMSIIRENANKASQEFGIELVDVRIKRVELPVAVAENVYKNMIEERRRIANERRSEGEAEKEKIRAKADHDRVVILAEAERKSQELRGQGEAEAANIYATAYNSHKNFYDFYRTLESYRKSLGKEGDFFVLEPKSDFFRFLKDSGAR